MDPSYAGPEFDFDKIIKELMMKVLLVMIQLWCSNIILGHQKEVLHTRHLQCSNKHQLHLCQPYAGMALTHIILMHCTHFQDVERRNSTTPKGPPDNIYACD